MQKTLERGAVLSLLPMAIRPIPPIVVQPILSRMMRKIVRDKPSLFDRIGTHQHKGFLIDPRNMGFVLLLRPDPRQACLKIYRRKHVPDYDAKISGSFLTLFRLFDGQEDGDALFFTRELSIEGDTEAIVCLRNAIDDQEENVTDYIAKSFGPIGVKSLNMLRKIAQKQKGC